MSPPSGLSESDSRNLLSAYDVPFAPSARVGGPREAGEAAERLGFPSSVKVSCERVAHKSERGLVRLGLPDAATVRRAVEEMTHAMRPEDGEFGWIVSPMIASTRELLVGLLRDEAFGPFVVVGSGGVHAEALDDVTLWPAIPETIDAEAMIGRLRQVAVYRSSRGEAAVDIDSLQATLMGLTRLAHERPDVESVDVNPILVRADGSLVAVDALVTLGEPEATGPRIVSTPSAEQVRALFEPRGVAIVGVSSHPGKFGFVALHNLLVNGYGGRVAAINRSGESVLGVDSVADVADLERGAFDLAMLCTPASINEEIVRSCAEVGIRAIFVASAGYRESGEEGAHAEERLAEVARECDVLVVGPNGQGLVSTPAALCAQIVAPYPPAGRISVVSQSGNLVSSFLNLARGSGVGVARAVSVGNAACVGPVELLPALATDTATGVGLVYIENTSAGSLLTDAVAYFTRHKPLVIVKGGRSEFGARAAASHTGALATSSRVVHAALEAAGATLVDDVDEAFDTAAAFATLPLPRGGSVAILTTVGGWGVLCADAIAESRTLQLATLPDDVIERVDMLLPARWSRGNPVDCAGGETRDTVPEIVEILVDCTAVDAIVLLGVGIQGNQAAMMRSGAFYPDHGLQRVVDYHERQEERYMATVSAAMARSGKPILVASELATSAHEGSAPRAARRSGLYLFPSGPRAIRALDRIHSHRRRVRPTP